MPLEARMDGTLVFGYLDTASSERAGAFDAVLVKTATPYAAEMRPERFGAITTCDIAGEQRAQVVPHASVSTEGVDTLLGVLLAGEVTIEQSGRKCALTPGDFVLYGGGRPFRLDLGSDYRWFLMRLDPGTSTLLQHTPDAMVAQELTGSPGGRILSSMLVELAHRGHRLGPVSKGEMGEHVTGILRTLVREHAGRHMHPVRADRLKHVLEHIDRHLAEELPPARIAAAHHISVRSLHALFQQRGETLGDHIRRRRLDRIRQDLADPGLAHLPAYAVAARWGLTESSYFGRVFKAAFGVSPREFRRWSLPGAVGE
ncbi:helix-turn-helix domain-containing protein [Streptomyces sp. NPDC006602]|uniref:helix-turn-helix domain-containing protein n=1 Tax=Streptomyces sp. NPDC006602 TaxID=3364751 RepID=UPI003677456F